MIPIEALSNAVPVISGGTPYVSGDFVYHKFESTGTFTVRGVFRLVPWRIRPRQVRILCLLGLV